jgi:1,2-diacylglycerol 3-beta-galactosyltransferase
LQTLADCQVDIVNPLRTPGTPAILRRVEGTYLDQVTYTPTLYRLNHEFTDSPLSSAVIRHGMRWFFRPALARLLREYRPDVVVSTYLMYGDPFHRVCQAMDCQVPYVTVVTEIGESAHALWFCPHDDRVMVANEVVAAKAQRYGVDPERIVQTGIPVDLRFAQPPSHVSELRARFGWAPDCPVVLLMGGGAGVGLVEETAHAIDDATLPAQLVIVAGRNPGLEQRLRAHAWHAPTTVYGFRNDVPDLMHAATVILTKAGGLSISEALAAGRPIILHSAIWGQETGNVSYLVESGAGVWADSPGTTAQILQRWLLDEPETLARHTAAAQCLGRPRASLDIAQQVLALAAPAGVAATRAGAAPTPAGSRVTSDRR